MRRGNGLKLRVQRRILCKRRGLGARKVCGTKKNGYECKGTETHSRMVARPAAYSAFVNVSEAELMQ